MRHRGGMSLRCRSDVAFLHRSDLAGRLGGDIALRRRSDIAGRLGGDIALRRRSDIAKRNHLGREGGRSDVAATFVKVAAMSLRPPCDLKFLLGVSFFSVIKLLKIRNEGNV